MSPHRIIAALELVATVLWWALVVALAVTVAALANGWTWLADLGAATILATFLPGVVILLVLLTAQVLATLGDAAGPDDVAHTVPAGVVEATPTGSGRPATGSGPATAANGVIPTK